MKKLTPVEEEIMEYFWHSNKPLAPQDIRRYFSERNWAPQTISTYLHRLIEKEFIAPSGREGRNLFYKFLISKEEYSLKKYNSALIKPLESLAATFCGKPSLLKEESDELFKLLKNFMDK